MTVSTTQQSVIFLGTGSATSFGFSFNNGVPFNSTQTLASYSVVYTDALGAETTLAPSTYSLSFNQAVTGSLWGLGGTLLYPLAGSPIASGTSLTLQRTFPLQQLTSISNQGDFAPQNIEAMGDLLEMQLQQISARTTQFRGTWQTAVAYSYGDIVQDGANGNNTLNYYICLTANTSGVWSTDLAAGDWGISALAAVPTGTLVLVGDINGSGASPIATTLATVNSNVGSFTNATVRVNAKGLVTAASSGSASAGTVTSVRYVGDGVLQSTTPSAAVTTSGNVTATLRTQTANMVLAGPSSGGNATPTFRSLVAADLPSSSAVNSYQATISSKTIVANTSGMLGLAGAITPNGSGRVMLIVACEAKGSVVAPIDFQLSYGTGAAPSNGDSVTGTQVGAITEIVVPSTGTTYLPFTMVYIISGLTPSTAYWLDMTSSYTGSGGATLNNISLSAFEIK